MILALIFNQKKYFKAKVHSKNKKLVKVLLKKRSGSEVIINHS
jgi:hypothetical protein